MERHVACTPVLGDPDRKQDGPGADLIQCGSCACPTDQGPFRAPLRSVSSLRLRRPLTGLAHSPGGRHNEKVHKSHPSRISARRIGHVGS